MWTFCWHGPFSMPSRIRRLSVRIKESQMAKLSWDVPTLAMAKFGVHLGDSRTNQTKESLKVIACCSEKVPETSSTSDSRFDLFTSSKIKSFIKSLTLYLSLPLFKLGRTQNRRFRDFLVLSSWSTIIAAAAAISKLIYRLIYYYTK